MAGTPGRSRPACAQTAAPHLRRLVSVLSSSAERVAMVFWSAFCNVLETSSSAASSAASAQRTHLVCKPIGHRQGTEILLCVRHGVGCEGGRRRRRRKGEGRGARRKERRQSTGSVVVVQVGQVVSQYVSCASFFEKTPKASSSSCCRQCSRRSRLLSRPKFAA